jgi:WD40 repeat protein
MAFHPRGDWVVASTALFNRLTFWPLRRPHPSVVDGYQFRHRPLAFSPDGNWLATSWGDQRLRLWPLPEKEVNDVRSLGRPDDRYTVRGLAFDPENRYVFAVGPQRAAVVPLDGSEPRNLQGFSEETVFNAAAVSPSGRFVATAFFYGQGEKTLRVWDLETDGIRRLELPESPSAGMGGDEERTGYERGILSLGFADESTVYTVGDGGLRRWSLEKGSNEAIAPALPGYRMRGSIHAEKGVALTAESRVAQPDTCVRALLHDLAAASSRELTEFGECSAWSAHGIALDASGTVAAIGSKDGIVRVGRLDGKEPHLLIGHRGAVDRVAISPDLRWVASTGEDNTLRLWPMPDLSAPPLHTLPQAELLAKLRSLTNLRVLRDPSSKGGWKVETGPFPGWKDSPSW